MTTWNVHVVPTPDDNGFCVSFDNPADALACAERLTAEGCWFVQVGN